ncbi:MAG TPA: FUSC family protein [Candidatus Sulfotelmatobacter sp.]|nr:FUSC family protein [Candidatus Sulfotelmatobacter sp.]
MASATPTLPLPQMPIPSAPSFWARNSRSFKQGIKTGLAGLITYALYIGWHLPQGYWAVITALVVTQVTLGASWKPALYRTIGSTAGALAAMLLMVIFGLGTFRVGIVLFLLASLFGFLTVRHPAFSAAGFTAAIVLLLGRIEGTPVHTGWLRVLYTLLGSFVAFAVGALIWPVRAREGLRKKIANILDGAGVLYRAVTASALQGVDNEQQVRELDRQLHDLRRGITQQMDEARSELAFSRFNQGAYQEFVDLSDQVRRRLTAMAEDRSLYMHAQVDYSMVPSLPKLVQETATAFQSLAKAVCNPGTAVATAELEASLGALDADLAALRAQRSTTPLTLDRMLPFWALVFNLREVAQELQNLESTLPQLA